MDDVSHDQTSYVVAPDFAKRAKLFGGGNKSLIMDELQAQGEVTLASSATLTTAQKRILKQLQTERDKLAQGSGDLSQQEKTQLEKRARADALTEARLKLIDANRLDAQMRYDKMTKTQQDTLNQQIRDEFDQEQAQQNIPADRRRKLGEESLGAKRLAKMSALTDEQHEEAQELADKNYKQELRDATHKAKTKKAKQIASMRSITNKDLEAAAIAVDQGSVLLTDHSGVHQLLDETGLGKARNLQDTVNSMVRSGALPPEYKDGMVATRVDFAKAAKINKEEAHSLGNKIAALMDKSRRRALNLRAESHKREKATFKKDRTRMAEWRQKRDNDHDNNMDM